MLKRWPASSKMRSPTRSSSWLKRLGECVECGFVDAHARLFHAEEDRRERVVDFLVDLGDLRFLCFFAQAGHQRVDDVRHSLPAMWVRFRRGARPHRQGTAWCAWD